MNRTRAAFASLAVFASAATSAPAQEPVPRDAATYANPVAARDFPDPAVIRHDNRYYVYGTQSGDDRLQAMESPDLVHWTPRKLDFRVTWSRAHLWAPEVSESGGTFYLTYSALDPSTKKHHIGLATATAPLGPYLDRGILVRGDDNRVGVIDATIFADRDGSAYLVYSEETPRRIVLRRMTPDRLGVEAEVFELIRPDRPWERGVVEAPILLLRAGVYHLFYSGGPYQGTKSTSRYVVAHARSDSATGPFVKSPLPLLQTVEGRVYGPGHPTLTTSADGHTWMLYHAWDDQNEPRYGSNPLGRTLRLDPVDWDGPEPRMSGPSLDARPAPAVSRAR